MTALTTILNLNVTIGESKSVPRIWLEGESLCLAGLKIKSRYFVKSTAANRIELHEAANDYAGKTFNVSSRDRHGVRRPLMEIRSNLLRELFQHCQKVRVAIRQGVIVITTLQKEINIIERCKRVMEKLRDRKPLELCSLFHAAGVMDSAFHKGLAQGGVDSFIKVAVEMSKVYLSASLRNNPELWRDESIVVQSDIRDVNYNNKTPACDVLIAGIPCNAASRAGKPKNGITFAEQHPDAGSLFFDFIKGVEAHNPAIVVAENVPDFQKTAGMAVIRSVLSSLGYNLFEAVLDGNDFGALEKRKRMVLVAVCKGLSCHFDFDDLQPVKSKEAALNDVLDVFSPDSVRWSDFKHLKEKWISDKEQGKGFAPQYLTGAEGHCGTIGKGYFKGRSTEPFIKHPTDPELMRLLTQYEHARIKAAPASLCANESETVAHEIYGQGVVYTKFVAIGAGIAQLLNRALGLFSFGERMALAA